MSEVVDTRGNDVANDAYERHKRIVELRDAVEMCFLELGEQLYWFKQHRAYEVLGHPTFESYIADPDVGLGRSAVYALIGNYERYMIELECPTVGLLEAGWSKLDLIRTHVTEDNVEEWVDKAAALSRSDLKREMKDAGMIDATEEWMWLPLPPTTNQQYGYGKGRVYLTKEAKAWREEAQWRLKEQWGREVLTGNVTLEYELFLDHDRDIDGVKLLLDALEGIVYENDRQITRWKGAKQGAVDVKPHVEVRVRG